jgi:hypothetical protein
VNNKQIRQRGNRSALIYIDTLKKESTSIMKLVHISSLVILLVAVGVVAGTAAPAFIIGQGHGRSGGGQCTRSSKQSVPALYFGRVPLSFNKSKSSLVRTQALENDDEDDGWGNDDDNGSSSSTSSPATAQKGKQPTSNSRVSTEKRRSAPKEQERDLFIPIFSLVSLAGLFGSYGYEMLRLYSRGELYLPWDHK